MEDIAKLIEARAPKAAVGARGPYKKASSGVEKLLGPHSWFRYGWRKRLWRAYLGRRAPFDFIGPQLIAFAAALLLLITRSPKWAFTIWVWVALAVALIVLYGPRDRR